MLKVKKNDRVKVIAGKDRGKVGKVLRVDPRNERIFVEGINIIKKHTRQRGQNQPGGIISKEGPIHISNVQVVCPSCSKPVRVGFEIKETGEKVRVCKKCNQEL
ncbi:MAG: 50S ribosomal protein L24 [Actinobacteria bacterium]|nr:50S ribosomal protein L24 [Actinomycetota bacterium]